MPRGMIPAKALDPFIDGIRRLEAKVEHLERKNNDLMSILTEISDLNTRLVDLFKISEEIMRTR